MKEFSIGELARVTGVKVPTIRYYEDVGLMEEAPRTEGGQRRYSASARDRLGFIAHAREMGFPIEAIRELIVLSQHPEKPCADADRIAEQRLAEVDAKIERLTRLRTELARMLDGHRCGTIASCRIIEVLGDHSNCAAEH